MKYETVAGRPSIPDTYRKLVDHLREAQDQAALLGHIYKEDGDDLRGSGMLGVSELLGRLASQTQKLATHTKTGLIIP